MQFYFKRRALHTRNRNNIMEGIYNVDNSAKRNQFLNWVFQSQVY